MTKLIFTSCMRIEAFPQQPQWAEIAKLKPDYLFILGDNIYMDYWPYNKKNSPKNLGQGAFREAMSKKYKLQWSEPHFQSLVQELRENRGGVYGTWDDHDFAWDNALGVDVPEPIKQTSKELFNQYFYQNPSQKEIFKFIDTDHARIIILDQRSYSEKAGINARLIGEQQINFLEKALNHSKVFTIICGALPLTQSVSVLGIQVPRLTNLWSKYSNEYQQFCTLIESKENVIYVAGDIHRNAFAKPKAGIRPCFEVISSGMAIDQFASQSVIKFKKPNNAYDARRNWTSFEINSDKVIITQSSESSIFKRKNKRFEIGNAKL